MTPTTDRRQNRRRRPVALLAVGGVGLALVVAGCGSAARGSNSHSGSNKGGAMASGGQGTIPTATDRPSHPRVKAPPPRAAVAKPAQPMPARRSVAPSTGTSVPATVGPARPKRSARPKPASVPAPPKSTPPPSGTAGIPQHNGGDADADNNGGPSDGDGNI
jgi:hypothetical protein